MSVATKHGLILEIDTKAVSDDGLFSGYASTFDVLDSHKEIVAAGAFTKSLASRPANKVKMLRGHDQSDPIGIWESLSEDARGLKATGRLILDTAKGRETHTLLKAGALDGLSIGFRTVRDRLDKTKGARILEEVDLWEISVVTFPSNAQSTVTAVKSTSFSELVAAINSARTSLKG
ncbi:HK97 family phage prohead protease [Mesorhizobium sp. M7A.F.Ca.ET.027.03.2.1]|uniref:HK97 family phage prohead protease n=1 Tax=Mesorhizobium sp. M7A.F.Ca.ET.027.03.2.1 TaxID=2496656 RepID=UPI000FCB7667|nr:HK97 family phage prohead protease [Mesorhizobium sp. M7A.F.Ca.ET.027.03.2.1]RVD62926.1 HK97 family phage prohead protease [Mesorhizobium sp. M7A.F.Ca.ET.027.03.2.1]